MHRPSPKIVVAIGAVVVLCTIGLVLYLRRSPEPSPSTGALPPSRPGVSATPSTLRPSAAPEGSTTAELTPAPPPAQVDSVRTKAPPAPTLNFTYTLETPLPEPTPTVPLTVYKEVTWEWSREIAQAYGFPEADPIVSGSSYIFEMTKGVEGRETTLSLAVDAFSGFTDFTATYPQNKRVTVATNSKADEVARAFLTKTGQLAPDLNPPKFYRLAKDPTTIYVEYQRAWKPLPILETFGMLRADIPAGGNLTPDPGSLYPDSEVFQTSDSTDGFGRLNDFNTATVSVDSGGRVTSAIVNTRPIDRILPDRALKTPQQAWEDLAVGKGVLGFALPDGSVPGDSWERTFPGGVASSENAAVKSAILAYVEKRNGIVQNYLQPVYLFKGRAPLTTGVMTSFIVAVPALADERLPQ